jgi:hypothetical protein
VACSLISVLVMRAHRTRHEILKASRRCVWRSLHIAAMAMEAAIDRKQEGSQEFANLIADIRQDFNSVETLWSYFDMWHKWLGKKPKVDYASLAFSLRPLYNHACSMYFSITSNSSERSPAIVELFSPPLRQLAQELRLISVPLQTCIKHIDMDVVARTAVDDASAEKMDTQDSLMWLVETVADTHLTKLRHILVVLEKMYCARREDIFLTMADRWWAVSLMSNMTATILAVVDYLVLIWPLLRNAAGLNPDDRRNVDVVSCLEEIRAKVLASIDAVSGANVEFQAFGGSTRIVVHSEVNKNDLDRNKS